MKAIYKSTGKARNPKGLVGEKVIALGLNGDGDVVVKGIAIATGQGGDVRGFIEKHSATGLAHVHYKGLETRPSIGDHSVPKFANIVNFTITQKRGGSRCCNLYEVGRVNNQYKYRSLHRSSPGKWKSREGWNP